ncbi:MAG: DUF692 domain-containing protein [Acidobacteriota bacterium]
MSGSRAVAPAVTTPRLGLPNLGFGLGLRSPHFPAWLRDGSRSDWIEAISENFMDSRGRPRRLLRELAEQRPVVLHGVALSIGSTDPLDLAYLAALDDLAREVDAPYVSDHLCWTGVGGEVSHDLLPIPRTEEALRHVVGRVGEVQDRLQRRLVLENPSRYLDFKASTLDEPSFLAAVAEEADCGILLDLNNVVVTCRNEGSDPQAFVAALPVERIVQVHVAGHVDLGTHLLDTHDAPVPDQVLGLLRELLERAPELPVLLEWDAQLPTLAELDDELDRVRAAARGETVAASPLERSRSHEGGAPVPQPWPVMTPHWDAPREPDA